MIQEFATLQVFKNIEPDGSPGAFDLLIEGVVERFGAGDGQGTVPVDIPAGTNTEPGAIVTFGESGDPAVLASYDTGTTVLCSDLDGTITHDIGLDENTWTFTAFPDQGVCVHDYQ